MILKEKPKTPYIERFNLPLRQRVSYSVYAQLAERAVCHRLVCTLTNPQIVCMTEV